MILSKICKWLFNLLLILIRIISDIFKKIYVGNIVHGVDFDPIKNLQVIIKCTVYNDSNHIWQKQNRYSSRKNSEWNWFWSYQKFARDYLMTCWYWFESYLTKNKKDIYLGNIAHGVNFDPIKNLYVIIQSLVDTDSNHIRHKQKNLSIEYSALS